MASTRNSFMATDYNVKKNENNRVKDYMFYRGSFVNDTPAYFVRGSNPSFYGGQLSHNSVDVESTLRGIRSTNLEGPSFKATPQFKSIPETEYFKVDPTYIPQPYLHSVVDRPLYLS